MIEDELAAEVVRRAKARGVTIVTAESCTAGTVALALSKAPGAGDVLYGGFIVYSKEMKAQVLGVRLDLLHERGAVCAEVAAAMAQGALNNSPADIAIAVTGVAGPEPDEDGNPVGLVYFGACSRNVEIYTERHMFSDRSQENFLRSTVQSALVILQKFCR